MYCICTVWQQIATQRLPQECLWNSGGGFAIPASLGKKNVFFCHNGCPCCCSRNGFATSESQTGIADWRTAIVNRPIENKKHSKKTRTQRFWVSDKKHLNVWVFLSLSCRNLFFPKCPSLCGFSGPRRKLCKSLPRDFWNVSESKKFNVWNFVAFVSHFFQISCSLRFQRGQANIWESFAAWILKHVGKRVKEWVSMFPVQVVSDWHGGLVASSGAVDSSSWTHWRDCAEPFLLL